MKSFCSIFKLYFIYPCVSVHFELFIVDGQVDVVEDHAFQDELELFLIGMEPHLQLNICISYHVFLC